MTSKKEAILGTATRLFAQHGYKAVGVDRIVAASGASKMTLYSHFGTKENLIVEVLRQRDAEFMAALCADMTQARPGLDRLRAMFAWHERWFAADDFHGCMFIRASEEFAGESEPIMAAARDHKLAILGLIDDCLSDAGVRDPHPIADILFTLIEGMIVNAHMFGPDRRPVPWSAIEGLVRPYLPAGSPPR